MQAREAWWGGRIQKKSTYESVHSAVKESRAKQVKASVKAVCEKAGMSRQNYYALHRRRQKLKVDGHSVIELVKQERQMQPKLGARKVLKRIQPRLEEQGIRMGRDRMLNLLRENDMLVKYEIQRPRTTQSNHSLPVFKNLIKDFTPEEPNKVWVCDITYIATEKGHSYLSLVTDLYSRKILGWELSDSLEHTGSLKALQQAVEQLPDGRKVISHSDRGCQYCCHAYAQYALNHRIELSMTEELHCYENANAERVNGILKLEYALGLVWPDHAQAKTAVAQAVNLYNNHRPHRSLRMEYPSEVHAMKN
jgi:transposase InsO family protein